MEIPDPKDSFYFENQFYLSCNINRIAKIIAHYELFKMILDLPGDIVECGVFKGASFSRFAMFRELLTNSYSRKLIGFDTFETFPETKHIGDKKKLAKFTKHAGNESISVEDMKRVLSNKRCEHNIVLVKGNICETVPQYIKDNPELRIVLLNLDTDIFEPAVTILDHLYPRVVNGGILVIDDYGVFPGETEAVDSYFSGKMVEIKKHPFSMTPSYIIKR